jgi:hypothetical protein
MAAPLRAARDVDAQTVVVTGVMIATSSVGTTVATASATIARASPASGESRAAVTPDSAVPSRSRRRVSANRRAFSMATPAVVARASMISWSSSEKRSFSGSVR